MTAELTPVQRRTLDLLRRNGEPVVFDADAVDAVRADLDRGLAELAERLDDAGADPEQLLPVRKHDLGEVFECEARWAAPQDFEWTPAKARGQVVHKAIQLAVHWRGEPVPAALVDEAIERLSDDEHGLGPWLSSLDHGDAADLRGRAVEHVTKFLECFPPLDPRWRPVTEGSIQYPLAGRIVLKAKIDLTLGVSVGTESRKVIIDHKTGRLLHRHREDLRFYALVETMKFAVPPRLLASYSLDSADAHVEEVTLDLLRSTVRRTLDGIERMIEIHHERRRPDTSPGPACRWCPLLPDCEPGQSFVNAADVV